MTRKPLTIAFIAGEASGDHLGAPLLAELRRRLRGACSFMGVGGHAMEAEGLRSIFPMSEIAVMGPIAILRQLPRLRRRLLDTVEAIVAARPDALVIIDCPEFSHRAAARVRARLPELPIIDYVAPSVWAWRSGRARKMVAYVEEVMALLPFEPETFARLKGPRCRYVGHPAAEHAPPTAEERARIEELLGERAGRPLLLVMPGSRLNEVDRLVGPFGDAVARLWEGGAGPAVVVPTLPHLGEALAERVSDWPGRPAVVTEPRLRHTSLVMADAAIVASGTATLELALAATPMVVGYRMERLFAWTRHVFLPVHSIVMANLIHGGSPVPELFQGNCTGPKLAAAVAPLLVPGPARDTQLAALAEVARKTRGEGGSASARAADIVLEAIEARAGRAAQPA